MKAIILAAGLGNRLLPLTEDVPKCLVQVNEVSILERELDALHRNFITEVILIVGYRKEKILGKIGCSYKGIKINYIENNKFNETNNVFSLWLAREHMKEGCILIEGDVVFDECILADLLQTDPKKSFWVVDDFSVEMNGCMLSTNSSFVIQTIEIIRTQMPTVRNNSYKSVGILKISPLFGSIFGKWLDECVKKGQTKIYYDLVIANHIKEYPIHILKVKSARWTEIDTVEDLGQANRLFKKL